MRRKRILISLLISLPIAAVAVPALSKKRARHNINRNESRAIAHLKNLSSAQAQLQASGRRDRDRDGAGEYGDFRDLAAVLDAAWQGGTRSRVELDGYVFEIHVPHAPDDRELAWRVYTWPAAYGWTGKRAFMINQQGDVMASSNQRTRYSGDTRRPDPSAAFLPGAGKAIATGTVAVNADGADGMRWTVT